jgi:spore coat protein U-like protein
MRFARVGSVLLAAAIVLMASWAGVHAQEASAEITATATVTPPPVEISPNDLNFGTLFPGDAVDIQGDFRAWDSENHWPGRLEIENLHGGGSFTVTFEVVQELTNGDATLDIFWDSDAHAGAAIQRTQGVGQSPTGYYSWMPVDGRAHEIFATPSTGQGAPTNFTLDATVYIGGRVAWTGDEPPGTYTGTIKVIVGFPN